MSTDLIRCPDCGGIIGATHVSDQGKPCTCFSGQSRPEETGGAKVKVCCMCGKDVTGRKRLRDSLGYWCYDCHKADQAKRHPEGVRCAECGRRVHNDALIDYEDVRICSKCHDDQIEAAQRKNRFKATVGTEAYRRHDLRNFLLLLGFFALLLGLILLKKFHLLGHLF